MTTPNDEQLDLLVGYALGTLTPDEIARVGALLDQHPELHQTLAGLQGAAQQIPLALPDAEPPPELRQRTLDRAVGRSPARGEPARARRTMQGGWPRRLIWGVLNLALLLAAIAGWWQLLGARAELNSARTELVRLREQQQQIIAVAAHPAGLIELNGPGGSGSVLRNTDGSAVLAVRLPQLEQGRVYQLWLLSGQGAPISGGTFAVDEQGYGTLALAPGAELQSARQFAITNEPAPGSPGPTSDILILG